MFLDVHHAENNAFLVAVVCALIVSAMDKGQGARPVVSF